MTTKKTVAELRPLPNPTVDTTTQSTEVDRRKRLVSLSSMDGVMLVLWRMLHLSVHYRCRATSIRNRSLGGGSRHPADVLNFTTAVCRLIDEKIASL
jgi:hypothetical protein